MLYTQTHIVIIVFAWIYYENMIALSLSLKQVVLCAVIGGSGKKWPGALFTCVHFVAQKAR